MTVGVLLITHSGIGGALLNVVTGTFGALPLKVAHLSVSRDPDPDFLLAKAGYLVNKLDKGDGVLVLTDMYGSTPSNIAQRLCHLGYAVRVLSGLNLPMLFRIMSYPFLSLTELAIKAVSGGKDGIVEPMVDLEMSIEKEINGQTHQPIVEEV